MREHNFVHETPHHTWQHWQLKHRINIQHLTWCASPHPLPMSSHFAHYPNSTHISLPHTHTHIVRALARTPCMLWQSRSLSHSLTNHASRVGSGSVLHVREEGTRFVVSTSSLLPLLRKRRLSAGGPSHLLPLLATSLPDSIAAISCGSQRQLAEQVPGP